MKLKKFNEIPAPPLPGVVWDPEAYESNPSWEGFGEFRPGIEKQGTKFILVDNFEDGSSYRTLLEPGYFIVYSSMFGYEAITPDEFKELYVEVDD